MNAKSARRLAVVAVALVAVALLIPLVAGLARAGDDDKPAAKSDDPFAGKIVLVHMDAEMEVLAGILTGVEFKEVQGRKFLVGVGVPTGRPGDWWVGRKVHIAWDKVTGYIVLSKDEFEEYLDELKEQDTAA